MADPGRGAVSRATMEVATALLTGAAGVAVCFGSYAVGIGWLETGPDSGYFPFYIGLLIIAGSVVNLAQAVIGSRYKDETFIDAARLRLVASFFLPLVVFAVLAVTLGLYVGTALYILGAMSLQGRYPWWKAALTGIAVGISFYVIFDIGFQVPLLKGPLEAWLGIY